MFYDIAPYILRNRKKIIPRALVALLMNLFFSELIRGNLEFLNNAIITFLELNGFFFLIYFAVIRCTFATRNWTILERSPELGILCIIFWTALLVISIPLQWVGNLDAFFNFALVWLILFHAIVIESKNLEKYFYFRKSSGAIIFHNIAINDDIVVFTATSKEKRFVIAKIEITDITLKEMGFFVKIVENRVYDFYLHYTKKNFEVLQELIQICKKPPITTEELNTQGSQSSWSLW